MNHQSLALGMSSDYNDQSTFQQRLQSASWELFHRGIRVSRDSCMHDSRIITVLELGCATGGNSVQPLEAVKKEVGSAEILIYQCDLASTKWEVLARTMAPLKDERTHFAFIASSFYDDLLPRGSVDFLFSFTAIHWVREHNPLWRSDAEYIATTRYPCVDSSFVLLSKQILKLLRTGGTAFLCFPCASSNDPARTLEECGPMIRMWYALRKAWALLMEFSQDEDDSEGGIAFGVSGSR